MPGEEGGKEGEREGSGAEHGTKPYRVVRMYLAERERERVQMLLRTLRPRLVCSDAEEGRNVSCEPRKGCLLGLLFLRLRI